jgi:uncharacterized protein
MKTIPENYPWKSVKRYNSYLNHCLNTFGERLQKVSIDAGFTCPNRDGSLGTGGCSFCDNDAFNPSYCQPLKPIIQQINEGIEFHAKRYRRASKYIAYFQAYSNSYSDIDNLKKIYAEALSHPLIAGISIGTRPDCIDDEKLEFLASIAKKYILTIEYGIESCYNETLLKINRGHTFELTIKALENTVNRGIFTGGHLVFGLPGETKEMMLREAAILSKLPLNSIKFHQLQILKNTVMEKQFSENPQNLVRFTLDEYVEFIIDFLELLRPDMVVERLAGEVPPRFLAVPAWGLIRYDAVQRMIEKRMEERDTWQGKKFVVS